MSPHPRRASIVALAAALTATAAGCATVAAQAWAWQPGQPLEPALSAAVWTATILGALAGAGLGLALSRPHNGERIASAGAPMR